MYVGFKPPNAHSGSANRSQREKPRVGIVFDSEYVTVTNDDIFGHSTVERSSEDEDKKTCLERKYATKVNSLPSQRHRSRLGFKLASEVISHGLEVKNINSGDELHETECRTFIYNVLSEYPDTQQEQKQVALDTADIENCRVACDVYADIDNNFQDENDDLESQSHSNTQTSEFGTMVSDDSIPVDNYKLFCDAYSNASNVQEEMYDSERHSLAYDFDSNCFIRYRKPSADSNRRVKRQILVYNVIPDGVDDKRNPVDNRLSIVTIASPHNRERYGEESGTSSRINYSTSRQSHPPQIIAHVIDKIKKNQCECVMPVSTKHSSAPIKLPMYSRDILTDDTEKEKKSNNPIHIFQETYLSATRLPENDRMIKEMRASAASGSNHKKGSRFSSREHSKEKSKIKKKFATHAMKECATETDTQKIGKTSDQINEVIQCGSSGINPMTRMSDMKHSNPQFTPLLTDIRNNVRSFVSKMESRSVKCSNTNLFCKFRTLVFGDCSSECTSSKSKECTNSCSQSTNNCYNVAAKAESSFFKTIGCFISEGRDKIYERLQESKSQKSRMDESIKAESSHSPPTSVEEVKKKKKKHEKRKHKHKIEIGTIEDDGVPLLSSNRIKIDNKKGYPLITANKIECYIY